jgi:hypothetical protein
MIARLAAGVRTLSTVGAFRSAWVSWAGKPFSGEIPSL